MKMTGNIRKMTRFVLVSDLHCCFNFQTPPGDVLIAAGDMTMHGTPEEFLELERWFKLQPQSRKLYVPGNHDLGAFTSQRVMKYDILKTPKWLVDEEVNTLENIRIYGSPWTYAPWGGLKWAFPLHGGTHSKEKWAEIPEGLDILVTHGPAYGISDEHWVTGQKLGDSYLLWRLQEMQSPPAIHAFGHIHSAAKVTQVGPTLHLNLSICDESYQPSQPVTLLDHHEGRWTVSYVDREGRKVDSLGEEIA